MKKSIATNKRMLHQKNKKINKISFLPGESKGKMNLKNKIQNRNRYSQCKVNTIQHNLIFL